MTAPTVLVMPDETRQAWVNAGRPAEWSFPSPTQPTKTCPTCVQRAKRPLSFLVCQECGRHDDDLTGGAGFGRVPLQRGDVLHLATVCLCGGSGKGALDGIEREWITCGLCGGSGVVPFAEATYTGAREQRLVEKSLEVVVCGEVRSTEQ